VGCVSVCGGGGRKHKLGEAVGFDHERSRQVNRTLRRARAGGIRWGAVALGWLAAGGEGTAAELTVGALLVSLLSGFLAYLVGGFVASKRARVSGGLNGAMTAVFGLVVGIVLALLLVILLALSSGGGDFPTGPIGFGEAGAGFLTGLLSFAANLLGGYLGGKLGAPSGR
jgi:FtsH-binding integral membrane protein